MEQNEKKISILSLPFFVTILIIGLAIVFGIKSLSFSQPKTVMGPTTEEQPEEQMPIEKILCEKSLCPQFAPPVQNFCETGTLIYRDPVLNAENNCYCESPPSCDTSKQ